MSQYSITPSNDPGQIQDTPISSKKKLQSLHVTGHVTRRWSIDSSSSSQSGHLASPSSNNRHLLLSSTLVKIFFFVQHQVNIWTLRGAKDFQIRVLEITGPIKLWETASTKDLTEKRPDESPVQTSSSSQSKSIGKSFNITFRSFKLSTSKPLSSLLKSKCHNPPQNTSPTRACLFLEALNNLENLSFKGVSPSHTSSQKKVRLPLPTKRRKWFLNKTPTWDLSWQILHHALSVWEPDLSISSPKLHSLTLEVPYFAFKILTHKAFLSMPKRQPHLHSKASFLIEWGLGLNHLWT